MDQKRIDLFEKIINQRLSNLSPSEKTTKINTIKDDKIEKELLNIQGKIKCQFLQNQNDCQQEDSQKTEEVKSIEKMASQDFNMVNDKFKSISTQYENNIERIKNDLKITIEEFKTMLK